MRKVFRANFPSDARECFACVLLALLLCADPRGFERGEFSSAWDLPRRCCRCMCSRHARKMA